MKHPGRWLWLLLLVPLALGLTRLRLDVEVFDLLPGDLAVVKGLKLYQQHFANARELIITVKAPEAELAQDAARSLAERLRRDTNLVANVTWEPPWLEHPEQAGELLAYLWFNQPPELFGQLSQRLAPENLAATVIAARQELATSLSPDEIARLSHDPFGLTRLPEGAAGAAPAFGQGEEAFASRDGTFRVVFVQARRELRTYRECRQWLQAVKAGASGAVGSSGPGGAGEQEQEQEQEQGIGRAAVGSTGPGRSRVLLGYTGRPAFVAEVALDMEHDMTFSVGGTAAIIGVLFWLAHKRIKPMLWLLTLLGLILGSTLALGGLIFGTINVVSMGFAAILLGLAVDYAVVHYQEALVHPGWSIPQIRRGIAPSIFWAAVTTISAFLVLNFGGLPGLAQLGTLVGLGVGLSAGIMIFEFLPPLFPGRNRAGPAAAGRQSPETGRGSGGSQGLRIANPRYSRLQVCATLTTHAEPAAVGTPRAAATGRLFAITGALLFFALAVLVWAGWPPIDPTAKPLRPRRSPAYAAMEQVQEHLSQTRQPLWLIISGRTETEVAGRLDEVQSLLDQALSNRLIAGFSLPTSLWPRPEFQAANREAARQLAAEREAFRQAARTNGFAQSALGLTERMLDTWQTASPVHGVFWPTNSMSQWIFEKLAARTPTNFFVIGLVNPATEDPAAAGLLQSRLPGRDVWLSGWELLGGAIFARVKANLWKVLAPMVLLVMLSLWLAFRRPSEMLLSLGVLSLSGLCLLTVMRLAGWGWNLLDLMAIPLVLGTGVDYSIFMQLALRRYQGDLQMASRSVGRALLLCGGTAMAGFGSLAWSSNAGMASLGQVCAVGIGSNMLIAIFLLPVWWERVVGPGGRREGSGRDRDSSWLSCSVANARPNPRAQVQSAGPEVPTAGLEVRSSAAPSSILHPPSSPPALAPPPAPGGQPSTPSALYRAELWRLGLLFVRLLPPRACARLSRVLAGVYCRLAAHRREVVLQNLLPPLQGEVAAAQKMTRELFDQFALKLVDLWRYEAGMPIDDLFGQATGWEHFTRAQAQGQGVLLLTPHLGNWELGGPWLARQGVALQVITLAEPGEDFTKLRRASRARWNIETLVIGHDPFGFIDIIRRLEGGATVALLVDRPPPASAVRVELFGRPFAASLAAAELARASGCVLLPVYVPRLEHTYTAHVLPPIPYDRAALRDRQARQQLTQQILRTFEPVIRRHLDQWYHFVPVWRAPE